MTEEISTYSSSNGEIAVNLEESSADQIYDFFQEIGGARFLFMGRDHLEFIPIKEAANPFTRYGRQLHTLFKETVYTTTFTFKEKKLLSSKEAGATVGPPTDFLCQERAMEQVIWEGKTIKILYPDNPIVDRHFLFATKTHRDSFKDMTKEEFCEVMDLAKRVGTLFNGEKYILCKTGYDAGQMVPHFHLHLMVVGNKSEGFRGRLKIFANILFNMIPFLQTRLKGEALLEKVSHYKGELKCLYS